MIGSISVWLIPTPFSKFKPKVLYSFQGHLFNSVTSMSIHNSGLVLATSCSRGTSGVVNIWSLFDGSLLNTHTGPGGVDDLCWMEDKLGLAVCFARSKVRKSIYNTLQHACRQIKLQCHLFNKFVVEL